MLEWVLCRPGRKDSFRTVDGALTVNRQWSLLTTTLVVFESRDYPH